jgi:hypothetical protein
VEAHVGTWREPAASSGRLFDPVAGRATGAPSAVHVRLLARCPVLPICARHPPAATRKRPAQREGSRAEGANAASSGQPPAVPAARSRSRGRLAHILPVSVTEWMSGSIPI